VEAEEGERCARGMRRPGKEKFGGQGTFGGQKGRKRRRGVHVESGKEEKVCKRHVKNSKEESLVTLNWCM
jgi:hypothetical protein